MSPVWVVGAGGGKALSGGFIFPMITFFLRVAGAGGVSFPPRPCARHTPRADVAHKDAVEKIVNPADGLTTRPLALVAEWF